MEGLTSVQSKALNFINDTLLEVGTPPTLRELCEHMGFSAIGSAQDIVAALRKKGFLETQERQAARAFVLTDKAKATFIPSIGYDDPGSIFHVPCLGYVPAGNPMEAVEERVDTMRVSASLFSRPKPKADNLFAVKTTGLSMVGAGILDGDWLIVNCQNDARPTEIVVARVEGDVTCKRLMRDKSGWFLKPENEEFHPIRAAFEVVGKVVALQRKF